MHLPTPSKIKEATLGIAVIVVSAVAIDRVNNFRETWPKDQRSPVVFSVHCALSDSGGSNIGHSAESDTLDIGVSFDYQVSGNDCCYWTGNSSRFVFWICGMGDLSYRNRNQHLWNSLFRMTQQGIGI